MYLLAFESSCDETAAAVLQMDEPRGVRKILSSKIASQAEVHALYGGVVPEIASRAHAQAISALTYQALEEAEMPLSAIDTVAVAAFPGLIGSLLVGVNFAKALAFAGGKPLVGVNHILGHVAACYLTHRTLRPPFVALVASGGHCSLLKMTDFTSAEVLGRTRDDAVGEGFDKAGRVLGLPYPGGKAMDELAGGGNPDAIAFPSAAVPGDSLDFSFSGLKTAVLNYANNCRQKGVDFRREDLAASFTAAVCRSIVRRLEELYRREPFSAFVLGGGVAANSHLRRALEEFGRKRGVEIYLPALSLCGDNAAMIGAQGYYEAMAGHFADSTLHPRADWAG